jgi:DNA modification methylase
VTDLNRIVIGDCRETLRTLPAGVFQCSVTSPPYWGLRDYGHADQIGLEPTPAEYVAKLVDVFREVRRVLADDGTLWLNLGDSYCGARGGGQGAGGLMADRSVAKSGCRVRNESREVLGLKPKDLVGIPWRAAFALQADGWYLRSDIIWSKPNPMPESVTDRPTKAHEYVFLLSKSERYHFNSVAVAEQATSYGRQHATDVPPPKVRALVESGHHGAGGNLSTNYERETRNIRTVWTIATQPYSGAHFATMPPKLAERCIMAGSRLGDAVIDPFMGSGTVGQVAEALGRRWLGCELNPAYAALSRERTAQSGLPFGGAL